MKLSLVLMLLILSCGGNNDNVSEETVKQIYDDCYKVSENMFKRIPKSEIKNLKVDELCDEDTSFYEGELDKACERACRDVYDLLKSRDQ